MKIKFSLTTVLLLGAINTVCAQQQNDHIFPAAKAARASVSFDSRGFLIQGKRTFIVSAGMEYARVPHELWEDRLMRLKRGGFNCVEIYTFWNFHEPHEGAFDFTGDHDLNAFLQLVKKMGLYAIVRVGPYYCAEWDMGGFPLWLKFKPGLKVRQDNKPFELAVAHFFDKLIPIVSQNQINRGGAVIMVQLENEHPRGWGTVTPDPYFKFLQAKALTLGLQVPYFFSGLHHGNDPAENKRSLDDAARPNPWFSTEFWTVWFDKYGSGLKEADLYGRRTWKIIAHGGNGYNYYMAHGGSNFGFTNDNEDAASYDYGAAVGQTGDLRPMYYQFKRNAFFARSFESILENSVDGGNAYNYLISDTALHVSSRKSPAGELIFLDNPGTSAIQTKLAINKETLPENGNLEILPGEIMPVVHDFSLAPGIRLDWSLARIMGISQQGRTTTVVVYGEINAYGELLFSTSGRARAIQNAGGFAAVGRQLRLKFQFGALSPESHAFSSGGQVIRIITVNRLLADRTWFLEAGGKNYVLAGPQYLSDAVVRNHELLLSTEYFPAQSDTTGTWLFKDSTEMLAAVSQVTLNSSSLATQPPQTRQPGAVLTRSPPGNLLFDAPWQVKSMTAPARATFDDSKWKASRYPLQMGADGDLSPDAWYRNNFLIVNPGLYTLRTKRGGDRVIIYLDGQKVNTGTLKNSRLQFPIDAGTHTLALFTAHNGRDKLFNVLGEIDTADLKGLADSVFLEKDQTKVALVNWRMQGSQGDFAEEAGWLEAGKGGAGKPGQEDNTGPVFYRNSFRYHPDSKMTAVFRFNFEGLGHGSVYVNGHNIGRYPELIPVQSMYLPECWLREGRNTLVIFDEDGNAPTKVSLIRENESFRTLKTFRYELK